MTSYLCSVVAMALFRAFSEIFNVEKYRDLEIVVKGQSRSLKVVPFDKLFYSNFVPRFLRYSTFMYSVALKPGFGVTKGHRK